MMSALQNLEVEGNIGAMAAMMKDVQKAAALQRTSWQHMGVGPQNLQNMYLYCLLGPTCRLSKEISPLPGVWPMSALRRQGGQTDLPLEVTTCTDRIPEMSKCVDHKTINAACRASL
jgi:hypothetical protein